ncbi:hypothetical protein [Duganella vulcania]|uniref:Uncharacterized protein n=1 Tax=Duganella vulcania TaxID=2692166 RepID=A0A845GEI0_9BURK|nr:hypothetical protein [Duganella vulcania]MYM92301.1 hypothetical protein [Duganella vulcania]
MKAPYTFDGNYVLDAEGDVASISDTLLALNGHQALFAALQSIKAQCVAPGANSKAFAAAVSTTAVKGLFDAMGPSGAPGPAGESEAVPLFSFKDVLEMASDSDFEQVLAELPGMLRAMRQKSKSESYVGFAWPLRWVPQGGASEITTHYSDGSYTTLVVPKP